MEMKKNWKLFIPHIEQNKLVGSGGLKIIGHSVLLTDENFISK